MGYPQTERGRGRKKGEETEKRKKEEREKGHCEKEEGGRI